ncbi:MAG: GGDEF domain-containing protein [Polyangiaceae bacterium]
MGNEKDDDLLRTAEVAALPIDEVEHETVPIDLGGTHPPPKISLKPRSEFGSEPPPVTVRVPQTTADEGWLGEDTSLTRATEKTLSVPTSVNPDRATLTVLSGIDAGQVLALDGLEHVLGRGTEADLWLEDPAISRAHARVVRRPDGHFAIEDLGSTNGTFVSGRRVEGRAELQSGDRIQIGPNQMLRFAITDDAEEELQRRLYESSTRDALTRAFNRKYLNERLLAEIAHARRHKTQLALLMLDLDRFKEVNDKHGHLTGDMVLRVVSSHMLRLIRIEDVLARYGGEEFVILVRSTSHKDAAILADRVRTTVERLQISAPTGGNALVVTVSVGVASLSELAPEAGANELVATADARLYRAKVGGRNRVCAED